MKLLHISDTHGQCPMNLPEADVLVHTGDYSFISPCSPLEHQLIELNKFNDYLGSIKDNYEIIIFTPGNHDFIFERNESLAKDTISNATVLIDEYYTHKGIKFYGTPSQPPFFNWAFNDDLEKRIEKYSLIPDDTDVLLTHCPPQDILDLVSSRSYSAGENVGCPRLRFEVENRIKPLLHCFGHIHQNNGVVEKDGTKYSNGCLMDDRYKPTGAHNIIEIKDNDDT